MKKLKLIFASAPDFSGNVKAMYEFINKNYKGKYELILIINDQNFAKKNGDKFNYCMFDKCKDVVESADVVFDTHGILLDYVTEKQIYVNLWHGQGPKKGGFFFEYNNMAPGDIDYCKKMSKKIDINIVTSELWRVIFSSLWDININKVIPTGQPRNDILINSDGKKNLCKLLGKKINKYKKIIFYLPTFRVGINRVESNLVNNNNLFLKEYDENKLITYLESNNYLLVIKKHPSEEANLPEIKSENIAYLKESEMNYKCISLYDILNSADLLLTDYSSVYIDYLILDRPVLFLNYDKKQFINNRGFIFDNLDFWCPGPQISTIEQLLNDITWCFKNKDFYSKERQEFRKLMYKYFDNNSSQRLYDYIFKDGKINCDLYDKNICQKRKNKIIEIIDKIRLKKGGE